jgi:hypothetical protein
VFGKNVERIDGNGKGNSRLEIESGISSLFKEASTVAAQDGPGR